MVWARLDGGEGSMEFGGWSDWSETYMRSFQSPKDFPTPERLTDGITRHPGSQRYMAARYRHDRHSDR